MTVRRVTERRAAPATTALIGRRRAIAAEGEQRRDTRKQDSPRDLTSSSPAARIARWGCADNGHLHPRPTHPPRPAATFPTARPCPRPRLPGSRDEPVGVPVR